MTKIDKQGEVEDQNERTEYDENENGSSSNGILAPLFKWPTSSGNVLVKGNSTLYVYYFEMFDLIIYTVC
jgi:hypothetical protein